MLDAAIETVTNTEGRPVFHSDRGAHYRWPGWRSRVYNAKLIRSMSRNGCSPDGAACEGFVGPLKTELFYPRTRQDITIDQLIQVVVSCIRWYNEERIKISSGSLNPIEYRESLGIAASTSPSIAPYHRGVKLQSAPTGGNPILTMGT